MYLVKDTRSSFFALGNRLENLFIMDIKEKKRRGRGEGERERNGGVSYDQVIIRNKINIAKEIIKKKQRNDKTILPSNYAQMKKGKGRGGGENNGANSFIIHEFFKVIINVGITRIVSYLFPFFYFFFFSLLNSKKGIGINFHMQHISHYTRICFRPKIINGHVSSLAISIEDLLRVIHDAIFTRRK